MAISTSFPPQRVWLQRYPGQQIAVVYGQQRKPIPLSPKEPPASLHPQIHLSTLQE